MPHLGGTSFCRSFSRSFLDCRSLERYRKGFERVAWSLLGIWQKPLLACTSGRGFLFHFRQSRRKMMKWSCQPRKATHGAACAHQ